MKVKFSVSTNKVGSENSEIIEIDDEELVNMDEDERQEVYDEYLNDWVWDHIDAWAEEVGEDG